MYISLLYHNNIQSRCSKSTPSPDFEQYSDCPIALLKAKGAHNLFLLAYDQSYIFVLLR